MQIAESLVKKAKVEQEGIVILTPYNAQVSGIKGLLQKMKLSKILVTTISKSQGERLLWASTAPPSYASPHDSTLIKNLSTIFTGVWRSRISEAGRFRSKRYV